MKLKTLPLRFLTKQSKRSFYMLALCFFCAFINEVKAQNNKPNIILILVDDADFKTLSCNGGKSYQTPHIDSMAQQGMNFTQCHASPVCSPSRTMLMTGKYNFRNYTKWGILDTGQRMIANLLRDAGYSTACFGKWQFDGGDLSIRQFGFDSYSVFNAYGEGENTDYRYKTPTIYTNGAFASQSQTLNKYGEDIFADSVIQFMTNHKSNPFFIYYPMVLVHEPFQPTPDDPAYDSWSKPTKSDTSYYPSMITYMDKKVGEILNAVKTLGIQNKTFIMFTCDNGTSSFIYEYENGSIMQGGKGKTTEYGTHVPLIVYGPQHVNPGTTNNDLIDFTDFFPTIASLAKVNIPQSYGPIDGVDFSPAFNSVNANARTFIFNHYDEKPNITTIPKRWAQTATYKLYDTLGTGKQKFYNIVNDPTERSPLANSSLTPNEIAIKQQLLNTINNYVMQGFPLFKKPKVLSVTDSSATIMDSIEINGGSGVYASGGVWDTVVDPVVKSNNYTSDNVLIGVFVSTVKNLQPGTVYHFRTYAKNKAGTGYSDDISFTTLSKPPVALSGIPVDGNSFTAHWTKCKGCSYNIDVATTNNFFTSQTDTLFEGFDNGTVLPAGWTITNGAAANNTVFGLMPPSIQFKLNNKFVQTSALNGVATRLSYLTKAVSQQVPQLVIEAFDGLKWDTVDVVLPPTQKKQTIVYNFQPGTNYSQFKFICIRDSGSFIIDDININYVNQVSSTVPGFDDRAVNDTSIIVTGLQPGTTYYYRVRAQKSGLSSDNSNVVAFTTCDLVLDSISLTNVACNSNNTGAIKVAVTGSNLSFNWTGPNGFSSNTQNLQNIGAGSYHLHISQPTGCSIDTTVDVTQLTCSGIISNNKIDNNSTGPVKDDALNVEVFPNPASDAFSINIRSNSRDNIGIIITDINGKKVYESSGNNYNNYLIGKAFSPGVYFIKVTQGENTKSFKLIKQK
jgi:arylsulfatase A